MSDLNRLRELSGISMPVKEEMGNMESRMIDAILSLSHHIESQGANVGLSENRVYEIANFLGNIIDEISDLNDDEFDID